MLIKVQDFKFQPSPKRVPIYILIGEEPYLMQQTAMSIKGHFKQSCQNEVDEKIIDLDASSQWHSLADEANSLNLFSQHTLLDIRYEKKTIDAQAKEFFTNYLNNPNAGCMLLFRAPQLSLKSIQHLEKNENVCIIQVKTPNTQAIMQWIHQRFKEDGITYELEVPNLIAQYTHGNLLAMAQTVEKIRLTHDSKSQLNTDKVSQQLYNQSEYQLYELSDACLKGETSQALIMVEQALSQRQEATLVLWLLAQEIRYLLHLKTQLQKGQTVSHAAQILKIWPSRQALYQHAVKRHTKQGLEQLLVDCAQLDEHIKSNRYRVSLPQTFKLITIALATGKRILPCQA